MRVRALPEADSGARSHNPGATAGSFVPRVIEKKQWSDVNQICLTLKPMGLSLHHFAFKKFLSVSVHPAIGYLATISYVLD